MKFIDFVLWQWMIITIYGDRKGQVDFKTLHLTVTMEDVSIPLKLTRVNRVIANEFLSVWITIDRTDVKFMKLNMANTVGEFTFYHDECTKSAFIYFHARRELNGVIDVRYYVKGFPIDESKKVHVIVPKYLHRVKMDELVTPRLSRSISNTTVYRKRRNLKLDVYPELLVAISHDTYTAIGQASKFSRGAATASHVLTVYNAADMLFGLMRSVNIQLNIAGIVIEGEPNQWNFESNKGWFLSPKSYIDINTIHPKISEYFWLHENHFPRHSYDIIIYHTRKLLKDHTDEHNLGHAAPTTGHFMFPPYVRKDRFTAIVKDFATYQHFSTISHEIAHLFDARHDRVGLYGYIFDVMSCEDSLMADRDYCSESCLKWSHQTDVEFAEFFSLPAHCNLKNYPRSLNVPEPITIFSAKEQCECYGFRSILGPKGYISEKDCGRALICISKHSEQFIEVPFQNGRYSMWFEKSLLDRRM